MAPYEHRQAGFLTIVFVGLAAVFTLGLTAFDPGIVIVTGPVLAILLLVLWLFHSLLVEVRDKQVIVSFGPGWPRRRFQVGDLLGVRVVRNKWYYGWGIRLIPHGWMFNVSGLDAVELELANNRRFRIGTDDAESLARSIRAALGVEQH